MPRASRSAGSSPGRQRKRASPGLQLGVGLRTRSVRERVVLRFTTAVAGPLQPRFDHGVFLFDWPRFDRSLDCRLRFVPHAQLDWPWSAVFAIGSHPRRFDCGVQADLASVLVDHGLQLRFRNHPLFLVRRQPCQLSMHQAHHAGRGCYCARFPLPNAGRCSMHELWLREQDVFHSLNVAASRQAL